MADGINGTAGAPFDIELSSDTENAGDERINLARAFLTLPLSRCRVF